MIGAAIGAALGGPAGIGTMIGMTVIPMIVEHMMAGGPSEEDKAKVKEIIDTQTMKLSQEQGIPFSEAQRQVQAELGPMLEKAVQKEPSALAGIAAMVGGGVAGHMVGGKIAKAMGSRAGKLTGATKNTVDARRAAGVDGRKSSVNMGKKLTQPKAAAPTDPEGQRLLSREADHGAEEYGELPGAADEFESADNMLQEMGPSPSKPVGLTAKPPAGPAEKPLAPQPSPSAPMKPASADEQLQAFQQADALASAQEHPELPDIKRRIAEVLANPETGEPMGVGKPFGFGLKNRRGLA